MTWATDTLAQSFGLQIVRTSELERHQMRLRNALSAQTTLTTTAQLQQQALDQARLQLQDMERQIIQAEKLAGLGQLVAEVAHDINNPLSFVHGNLTFVEQYAQDLTALIEVYQQHCPVSCAPVEAIIDDIGLPFIKKDFPEVLASLQVGVDRIRDLTQSLTQYARRDDADPMPVNIHEGIDTTLLLLRHRLTNSGLHQSPITLTKAYGDLPAIQGFPGQITQVIANIVSNGIDALCESPQPAPAIHIQTRQLDPAWIRITISDNGPGMSPETQSKVFEPFFTTKPAGQGTGLGLAISRQIIVERHRGRLCSHSSPEGTTFDIDLPVHSAALTS